MTSFDNFEMDQLPAGKENSSYNLKTRGVSISDSIQSSHNSLAGSLESLTSPIGVPIGVSVIPVKESLAGLSIAVPQPANQLNIPAYTSAKHYANLPNPQNAVSSVLISTNDSAQLTTAPIMSIPQQQVIQIIQGAGEMSVPQRSQHAEILHMPNNNNSSNIEELAISKHIETFNKPPSRLFPSAKVPAPASDIPHPQLISVYQSAPPHHNQLMQTPEQARILLPSQPATTPEGYQILQTLSKPGQLSQEMGPVQQFVLASPPEVSYANQRNGNIPYSIITTPSFANSAISQPVQAMKPLSPPKQVRTHKHLLNYPPNTRPQQAQIKTEPGYPSHVQPMGNTAQTPQSPQETDHRRAESTSSGTGVPRKRKTGVPRKIVQSNPKIKKERNEAGEEMDFSQETDDNCEESCGSPFGTDSFPEMDYSPGSDPSNSLPNTSLVESHVLPSIMLAEGSKVTFTTWNEYCQLTGSLPAPYALLNHNNSLVPESNLFQVAITLEILDWTPDRHFAVRLVTVSRIQGSRLRLELMGSETRQSLWTTIDSYRLHYLGWGSERGLTYLPPDDLPADLTWHDYVQEILATQENSNFDILRPSFDQEMNAFFTLFRPGMLLEAAMDPLNREVISVCVVKRCSGQTVLLYEQNEDELSEFSRFYQEFPVDSPYIRALGWANKHHKQLRPSKESSNSKDWPQLLAKIIIHKNRLPVPLEAFNRTSCFYPGMKLEVVDWKEQEIIRVATVISVKDKQQIKVHYDGLPNEMDYWFDADGKDIFPPGYCDTTGHPLEKPEDLDISQAAPAILCQMDSANLAAPPVLQSPTILSQIPSVSNDSPTLEEITPPPSNTRFEQEVLQPKVTVTLHVSRNSFPGPYLSRELIKLIPTEIGPTSPVQAQALLLNYLLDASTDRRLLWDKFEDCPGPNTFVLSYEPNSSICKSIPNIESFHELYNSLNKLREKLDFAPDFIRIGTPPANHEVHQPDKIPSSIPAYTLPQSKILLSPNSTLPQTILNNIHPPVVTCRPNVIQSLPPKFEPNATVFQVHPPPPSIPITASSRNVPMYQTKQKPVMYQAPITTTRPVLQVLPSSHINVPIGTHPTNILPPPSSYMNGNSHPQPQAFRHPYPSPANWTVDQVCEFIRTIDHANVEEIVQKFKEQQIDGACLVELKVELLINYLKLELGPAMKIMKSIQQILPPIIMRRGDVSPSK